MAQSIINIGIQADDGSGDTIRLAGTNVEKGNKILKESKLNYIEASTLEEAANKAVAALK